jgi:hypothetical protein
MLGTRFEHLSQRGQGHPHHQVVQRVIVEDFIVQYRALAALHDDGQSGLIDRRHSAAGQRERRQCGLMGPIR